MNVTPDTIVYWEYGPIVLNATIVYTWIVMAIMVIGSWLITRNLAHDPYISQGQNLLEVIVETVQDQIREISHQEPNRYLPFIGTLFLFIAISNFLVIVPGYYPPTGSLSTTTALALLVFVAIPIFGITVGGVGSYMKQYVQPNVLMLPFNIISEISRTLALAVRLFGNIMSGSMIVAILLAVTPFFFPIVVNALGLLTGLIQAYIFAVLAMVYIASATRAREGEMAEQQAKQTEKG